MNKIVLFQLDSPNAKRKIRSYENEVFSKSRAGISKKLISGESVELMAAYSKSTLDLLHLNLEL